MGKKDKQSKKSQKEAKKQPVIVDTIDTLTIEKQPDNDDSPKENRRQVPEEGERKTAEERSQEYINNSTKYHRQFVDQFESEFQKLIQDQDYSEELKSLTPKEEAERKKFEKLIKKELNEVEDIASPGATNAKAVYEKILRTLGCSRKLTKMNNGIVREREEVVVKMKDLKAQMAKLVKSKEMLSSICDTFMKQNFDLYLKHEKMLD